MGGVKNLHEELQGIQLVVSGVGTAESKCKSLFMSNGKSSLWLIEININVKYFNLLESTVFIIN